MRNTTVFVLGTTLFVFACLSPAMASDPGELIKDYSRSLFSGDYRSAFDMLDSGFRSKFPKDSGPQSMKSLSKRLEKETGGLESIEILEKKVNGDRATIKYRLKFRNGQSYETSNSLKKEKGRWKLTVDTPAP